MQRHIRNEEELPIYTAPATPVAPDPYRGFSFARCDNRVFYKDKFQFRRWDKLFS